MTPGADDRRLRGVLPPVATPFRDGEVAPVLLRANLDRLKGAGLSGFLVLGSNGEAPLLREDEKLRLVEAARQATPPELVLMVGAAGESTDEAARFVNRVAELGADCALVLTPSYYGGAMTGEALRAHFLGVAEAARIPILIYVVPQFANGVVVDGDTMARLAEHSNIRGFKDSSGHMGRFAEYVRKIPPSFAAFAGNADTFLAALALGAAGGILAVANLLPRACVQLQEAAASGRLDEARRIQAAITPLARAVTVEHGIPALKAALDLLGHHGGLPRPPLLPVGEPVLARLRTLLDEAAGALSPRSTSDSSLRG
jgi:4-hydroxy-2-oxoglutarate aldolase